MLRVLDLADHTHTQLFSGCYPSYRMISYLNTMMFSKVNVGGLRESPGKVLELLSKKYGKLVDSAFFPDFSLAVEVIMEHHVYSCRHLMLVLRFISK